MTALLMAPAANDHPSPLAEAHALAQYARAYLTRLGVADHPLARYVLVQLAQETQAADCLTLGEARISWLTL